VAFAERGDRPHVVVYDLVSISTTFDTKKLDRFTIEKYCTDHDMAFPLIQKRQTFLQ